MSWGWCDPASLHVHCWPPGSPDHRQVMVPLIQCHTSGFGWDESSCHFRHHLTNLLAPRNLFQKSESHRLTAAEAEASRHFA